MIPDCKKRHVVSYEKMSESLSEAFAQKYPEGVNTCLDDLVKYPKPDGTCFYAVTIETADSVNLVKIPVKVDDLDEVRKWLDSEEVAEVEQVAGASSSSEAPDTTIPDDNISEFGGDEEASES